MILLDTHIWLWWILGDEGLSQDESEKLDSLAVRNQLHLSAISIWEIEILARKGKMSFFPDFEQWIEKVLTMDSIKVLPISSNLIVAQRKLPTNFHGDPADRLITATSLYTGFPLVTKDFKIVESGSCEIYEL